MKLTKKQFTKFIKEVTDETLNEYETVTLEEYRVFFIDTKTNQPAVFKMRVEDKWSLDRQIEDFVQWQKQQGKELALDQTKSPQYIRRIRIDDEGNISENLAKACPNKVSETISEATSADAKQFALDIVEKIKDRQRKKGFGDMNITEAISQMIEFKLAKEGWTKSGPSEPTTPTAPAWIAGQGYVKE